MFRTLASQLSKFWSLQAVCLAAVWRGVLVSCLVGCLVGCNDKLPNFKVWVSNVRALETSPTQGTDGPTCSAGRTYSLQADMRAPGTAAVVKSNIIFVVDTSGSMGPELLKLQTSLPGFINQLNQQLSSNHKVVLHASVSGWSLQGVYVHNRAVGSTDKLHKIEMGLKGNINSKIPDSQLFFDSGTIFHYVVVTDDLEQYDACGPLASQVPAGAPYSAASVAHYEACLINRYQSGVGAFLEARGLSHRLHAIHFKNAASASNQCAIGSAAGTQLSETGAPYVSLTQAFGGGSHDLCQDNWNGLLSGLVDQIASDAQGEALQLQECAEGGVAIQRVVVKQGDFSRVLEMSDAGALLFQQGSSGAPASIRLQSAYLRQLIMTNQLDGSKPYSLQVDYSVL